MQWDCAIANVLNNSAAFEFRSIRSPNSRLSTRLALPIRNFFSSLQTHLQSGTTTTLGLQRFLRNLAQIFLLVSAGYPASQGVPGDIRFWRPLRQRQAQGSAFISTGVSLRRAKVFICHAQVWRTGWEPVLEGGDCDGEGWQYAPRWIKPGEGNWSNSMGRGHFVRRRRWVRLREWVGWVPTR